MIDTDFSGLITSSELAEAMKAAHIDGVSSDEIDKIISEIDYVGNGMISMTEFLSATLSMDLSDGILEHLFHKFDIEKKGFIS